MKNYKIKTCFVSLERPKAQAKKTGIKFMVFIFLYLWENVCNTMLYMIFQYG